MSFPVDRARERGIGRKPAQIVEDRTRAVGVKRLLASTTQAFIHFQLKAGFTQPENRKQRMRRVVPRRRLLEYLDVARPRPLPSVLCLELHALSFAQQLENCTRY